MGIERKDSLSRRDFHIGAAGVAGWTMMPSGTAFGQARILARAEITQSLGSDEPVAVMADRIAYLMADDATMSPGVRVNQSGPDAIKRFWVEEWHSPEQEFSWTVNVVKPGKYQLTAMASAPTGSVVRVTGPTNVVEFTTVQSLSNGYYWDRIVPATMLDLPSGTSRISIKLDKEVSAPPHDVALKSLELLHADVVSNLNRRVRAFRSDTSWLNRAKFGFMCQCGEWSYPAHGPKKPWPGMADDFDVEKFANMVQSTGAGYVIWSATWANYYLPAPIKAIDAILPGRTSQRDLIGDMADALGRRNIKLMLYYHVGHDPRPTNAGWWPRNWVNKHDKDLVVKNWTAIVTEVGQRYGDRLAGWLFDDELVYYPAPYEALGKAAKAGSAKRIISYNSWIQGRGTDFQDFQFGEGFQGSTALPVSANGIWQSGPQKNLHAHGMFTLDGPGWGILTAERVITPPQVTTARALELALSAAERNEALSWNLMMYEDGSVAPESLAVLQTVGKAVREKYPL